jgi:hypothetical protein
MMLLFCPDALCALDGPPDCWRRLISLYGKFHAAIGEEKRRVQKKKTGQCLYQLLNNIALSRPGGHGGVAAPVPIPNTAVKRPSANGTSSQDAGE